MQEKIQQKNNQILLVAAYLAVSLFLILDLFGNYGPNLMANSLCFKYMGCNIDFFGYDALVHLVSGITEIILIIWTMRRFPSLQLLHGSFWKDLVVALSLVLLIGFLWEFVEFSCDHYRILVLHINIISPNTLYQPTNDDTMGDLSAEVVGALLVAPFFLSFSKKN